MSLALGIDTGGTYTDAVLYHEELGIVASAKSLTTHAALEIGIAGAVQAVMESAACAPGDIGLVSISTTLATNALVEGRGANVGVVLIGMGEAALDRAGLREAVADGPVLLMAGGHDAQGREAATPDFAALDAFLAGLDTDHLDAFAVAGLFAVREPAHEIAVRDRIRAQTGLPVSCSHDLANALGGPQRALTAVLNARLIGLIDDLICAAERHLAEVGIAAPLMVVRGDGALMSAGVARERPIETILSGPAASCVGAAHLCGVRSGLVSDIGGTTTDVAILREGVPDIDPQGARVGGWQTMVRAVAMHTYGLGGDSAVDIAIDGLNWRVTLGPQRRVPLSALAHAHGQRITAALERQMRRERPSDLDGLFVVPGGRGRTRQQAATRPEGGRPGRASGALDQRLATLSEPMLLEELVAQRRDLAQIKAAVTAGSVRLAGVTPTDAAHVLGLHDAFDGPAARLGLRLLARRRDARGEAIVSDACPEAMARCVIDGLTRASAHALLDVVMGAADLPTTRDIDARLLRALEAGGAPLLSARLAIDIPIVAVGASAATYYPAIADRVGAQLTVPSAAGVANAVGAVVGPVRVSVSVTVTQPAQGRFIVHGPDAAQTLGDQHEAVEAAMHLARETALMRATLAGASAPDVTVMCEIADAEIEGTRVFISAEVTAIATGRAAVADSNE